MIGIFNLLFYFFSLISFANTLDARSVQHLTLDPRKSSSLRVETELVSPAGVALVHVAHLAEAANAPGAAPVVVRLDSTATLDVAGACAHRRRSRRRLLMLVTHVERAVVHP